MTHFFVWATNSDTPAIIDECDATIAMARNWHSFSGGYFRTAKGELLHRLIVGAPKHLEVDHINRNPLDNRRENLRICTHAQNMANSRMRKNNALGIRGVYRHRRKFRGQVTSGGVMHRASFATAQEAGQWVRAKALELHGEFACLDGCPQ